MRTSQLNVGTATDVSLKITETDLSSLTASIRAPSGNEEPCLLKRLPNRHIGEQTCRIPSVASHTLLFTPCLHRIGLINGALVVAFNIWLFCNMENIFKTFISRIFRPRAS